MNVAVPEISSHLFAIGIANIFRARKKLNGALTDQLGSLDVILLPPQWHTEKLSKYTPGVSIFIFTDSDSPFFKLTNVLYASMYLKLFPEFNSVKLWHIIKYNS